MEREGGPPILHTSLSASYNFGLGRLPEYSAPPRVNPGLFSTNYGFPGVAITRQISIHNWIEVCRIENQNPILRFANFLREVTQMNSLRISVAFLTVAINKAQLGEVVVVHKDRAPAICRDLFKRPHICFELSTGFNIFTKKE